jgi:2-polyprenyl-3-methyl-5-hydroxy-6-metoxy-1,4-benzoquinol methylase
MATVEEHYARHLGPVYAWMVGDIDAALARSDLELDALAVAPQGTGTAIDLGAGIGLHAIPLARRGFTVTAIDSDELLLQELASRAGPLPIRTVKADLMDFGAQARAPADIILCMGDTLTHLPSHTAVASLLTTAAANLHRGGLFAATFRDYATAPLQGDARFIQVRSDAERMLTCFLEYADTTVTVHDLLQQREGSAWRLRVSSYPKLRLAPQWVADQLTALGLTVRRDTAAGGMIRIRAAAA